MDVAPSHPTYVYHWKVPDFRGSVLYPLNQLKSVYPDLYLEGKQKYSGREITTSCRIPPLGNCLWNDVLHLCPVHPRLVKAALEEAGHQCEVKEWFQIEARLLNPSATVVYKFTAPLAMDDVAKASAQIASDYSEFNAEVLEEFAEVPEATRRYYSSIEPETSYPLYFMYGRLLGGNPTN
jgi:hypothetical protein